jgi:(p)ppGpp synthase/HD superfamily hydrolase
MTDAKSLTVQSTLFDAICFASHKHRFQKRKNADATPYIDHPLNVMRLVHDVGGISDQAILQAAVLHDTVEDTKTTLQEIEDVFGAAVAGIVLECTDDKTLTKEQRKLLQIKNAPHKSKAAKIVKLADKCHNLSSLLDDAPTTWDKERIQNYFSWARRVIEGCRGANAGLEKYFDNLCHPRRTVQCRHTKEEYNVLPPDWQTRPVL